ncbi:hypothetical protein DL96DRAFT_1553115 [Flagelloscypha sp. PMI_526]|nr:hypothetical protein DL96DRAFT_1553115 [Flagelloscypha sp. PMI_526]
MKRPEIWGYRASWADGMEKTRLGECANVRDNKQNWGSTCLGIPNIMVKSKMRSMSSTGRTQRVPLSSSVVMAAVVQHVKKQLPLTRSRRPSSRQRGMRFFFRMMLLKDTTSNLLISGNNCLSVRTSSKAEYASVTIFEPKFVATIGLIYTEKSQSNCSSVSWLPNLGSHKDRKRQDASRNHPQVTQGPSPEKIVIEKSRLLLLSEIIPGKETKEIQTAETNESPKDLIEHNQYIGWNHQLGNMLPQGRP